jgi:hypothetical protein
MIRGFVVISLAASIAASSAAAASAPTQYSIVETASLFMAGQIIKIYRDGDRAMMEQFAPKQSNGARVPHTRTYYDLKAGRSYTLDLDNPQTPCISSAVAGDWGDPFASSAEMSAELAKQKPADGGEDTVNGVKTKVLIATAPQGSATLWVEPRTGLVMKWQAAEPNGAPRTVIEVTQFVLGAPPAATFALPAACGARSGETQSLHLTSVPGDAANAVMPPASANSCTALLRVVPTGKMTPLTGGYQVAIDRNVDPNRLASYSVDLAADGHANFSGGGLREETTSIGDGTLRIDNIPRQIHVELCFGKGGCASALIYRQCTAPESVLLFAVRDPARLSDGGDWLWVKAAKPRP